MYQFVTYFSISSEVGSYIDHNVSYYIGTQKGSYMGSFLEIYSTVAVSKRIENDIKFLKKE